MTAENKLKLERLDPFRKRRAIKAVTAVTALADHAGIRYEPSCKHGCRRRDSSWLLQYSCCGVC